MTCRSELWRGALWMSTSMTDGYIKSKEHGILRRIDEGVQRSMELKPYLSHEAICSLVTGRGLPCFLLLS